jgi:hypothetical protein
MGKSQTRRLREATRRFGREDRNRLVNVRAALSVLVYQRKVEAGLVSPIARSVYNGPTVIKRYSSYLSYEQNEETYGRPLR